MLLTLSPLTPRAFSRTIQAESENEGEKVYSGEHPESELLREAVSTVLDFGLITLSKKLKYNLSIVLRKKVNSDADCGQENDYTGNLVCSNKAIPITLTWVLLLPH